MNRVILTGRVTKDIDLRKTQSNLSVVSFSIAVDTKEKDEQGRYKAEFYNVTAWRNTADFLANYVQKGELIGIDGRLHTSSFVNQDGKKVNQVEVVADEVQKMNWEKKQPDNQPKGEAKVTQTFSEIKSDDLPFY